MDFICKEKTKHPTDVNKNENASQEFTELEDAELVLLLDLNLVNNITRFLFALLTAVIHQRPDANAIVPKIQICILFLLILLLYLE